MNKSSITLWVDTDTNNLLTGFNTNAVANTPTFKQGDNFEIDIHFLKRFGNSSFELPTAGSSYKLAIGNPDALPTSGTWILAYGSSQVEFDYDETDSSVEASLNLIPEIIADGGVKVVLVNGGTTYRISFNNKVGISSAFTTDSSNLIPSSYATVSQIKTGSATTRGVWHIKLKQIPVAYQSTWTHSTQPLATVTAIDSNTMRVEINPAPKDGTFFVSGTYYNDRGQSGTWRSMPMSVFATEAMVVSAIRLPTVVTVNKSGLYSWDITISDREYQDNGTVIASYIVSDADDAGIIGYDFITGSISLNNYEVSALLNGGAFVDTVLEVEITTGLTVATVLQTSCRIVADVIAQGIYAPIPFDNPISQADLNSSLLNYVQKSGGMMDANANLGFLTPSSTTQVGGSSIIIDSIGATNQTLITHDGVTVSDAVGSVIVDATGVTFPDGTTQTSATATVDLSDLVSKSTTTFQTLASGLGTSNTFQAYYSLGSPSYQKGNASIGGGFINSQVYNGENPFNNNPPSVEGEYQIEFVSGNTDLLRVQRQIARDDGVHFNRFGFGLGSGAHLEGGGMEGFGVEYFPPFGDPQKISILPSGIRFNDNTVQTTAGYPRYGNPEGYQTYYDVANNYYPLHTNPSGYLHQGDDSTVPAGGLAGQVLTKATNDSYVLSWESLPSLAGYAQLAGATFLGKVNFTPVAGSAGLNIGIGGVQATANVAGDMWIATGGTVLNYRDASGAVRIVAARNLANTFTNAQIISIGDTNAALRITQTGTGHALVVEDGTPNPNDTSAFVVNNDGCLGIGVDPATWTTTNKLEVQGTALFGGKIATTATSTTAPLNVAVSTTAPTTTVAGDVWVGSNNVFFKDSTNAQRIVANLNSQNTFQSPQIISATTTSTLLRITQTGTGNAFIVEDGSSTNPDTDSFVIDNSGNVGIGVNPNSFTATQKLELNGNIKFLADSSVQTTAYIPSNVAITGGSINSATSIDGGTY